MFEPLYVACCGLYILNRWGIRPHTQIEFFRCWFNDLLLIPCALPPLLQVYRWLKLRRDGPPTGAEVFGHLVLWSVLFEAAGPYLKAGSTGDWRDVAAYTASALVAFVCWREKGATRNAPR